MKYVVKRIAMFCLVLVVVFAFSGCERERHPEQPKVAGVHHYVTAYQNGWISKTDLKSIAYYYNTLVTGEEEKRYKPKAKNPETLDEETIEKIKYAYFEMWHNDYGYWSLEDIPLLIDVAQTQIDYFGTYNGCVALKIISDYVGDTSHRYAFKIGGVEFRKYHHAELYIWINEV